MSTKFISKNSNYMVVLRPGVEGNRALGTHAVPGLYIKFQDGMVNVNEESMIEMMREHPSCGTDFVEVKESETDPYATSRTSIEPKHTITEIDYGHPGKKGGEKQTIKMTPELKKIIRDEALNLLKTDPSIIKDLISSLKETAVKSEEKENTDIDDTDNTDEISENKEEETVEKEEEASPVKKNTKKTK